MNLGDDIFPVVRNSSKVVFNLFVHLLMKFFPGDQARQYPDRGALSGITTRTGGTLQV